MALFQQTSDDEWRHKRSQEQLALGGLPLNAEFRLRRLAENRRLFTSDLSVNEFALVRASGVIPCAQVTGSCAFHVGWRPTPGYESRELTDLSRAQTEARRRALVRMLTEARQIGAQAVIGVRLIGNTLDGGEDMVEFTAVGTAVRTPLRPSASFPFACTLTGQEFHALHQAGYHPVGLAFGVCVYHQVASRATTQIMQGGLWNGAGRMNQEMTEYTQGFYEARRVATECMEDDALSHHAEGIVAVQIEHSLEVREVEVEINEKKVQRRDLIATFVAMGTTIRSDGERPHTIASVLPLNA